MTQAVVGKFPAGQIVLYLLPPSHSLIVVYGKDARVGEETNTEEEDAGSVSRIRQGRRAG